MNIKKFGQFVNERIDNKQDIGFEIKYGLIVLSQKDLEKDIYEILHFVGYDEEPTDLNIEQLRDELKTDESFGLTGMWDDLIIIRASEETVEEYREITGGDKLLEGKSSDIENVGHGIKYRNEVFPGVNQPKRYDGKGKHKWRVLAREGDKVKVINFGKKLDVKESFTKLSKKYWENKYK